MGAEASRQHESGLMNDISHEDSTPRVGHERGTPPPSTGDLESRDGTQKHDPDPVSTRPLLPNNQIRFQPSKTQAAQLLAQCTLFEHRNTGENVSVDVKNSLPSLPSLTESSEDHFHETMHNLLVQFNGCSTQFGRKTLVSSPRNGRNHVEVADTTASATEGNNSLSSILIPETFERDDSTLLKQRLKENSPPGIMRAPEPQSNSSLSIVVGRSSVSSVLLHGPDEHNLKLTDGDPELASEIQEEMPFPLAATYADAANLAMKYPHLASKILAAPLRPGGSPDNTKVLVPPADDYQVSEVQTSKRCHRGRGLPNTRGRKPAIRVEKKRTSLPLGGPRKDNETLEREKTSAATAPAKRLSRRTKSPAGKGDKGGISDEIQDKRTIGDHPTRNTVRHGNPSPALQVDVWKAIRATAEHSKKQSGPHASLRHSDTRSPSNRAIVDMSARNGLERRLPMELRTGRTHSPEDDTLRPQDRVLGSHILREDNLITTPPSAAEIEELLDQAMPRANLAAPFDTSPHTPDPGFVPPSDAPMPTRLQFDPIVSTPIEDSSAFPDSISQPNQITTGSKDRDSFGANKNAATREGLLVRRYHLQADFSPSNAKVDDRSDRYYDEIKLLASSHRRVAAKTSTSEIHRYRYTSV